MQLKRITLHTSWKNIYADTHSACDLLTLFSIPHTLADYQEHSVLFNFICAIGEKTYQLWNVKIFTSFVFVISKHFYLLGNT